MSRYSILLKADSTVADIPASVAKPQAVTLVFVIHAGQTLIYKPGLTTETLTVSPSPTHC